MSSSCELIDAIHRSGRRAVIAVTGGGSLAISDLLTVPGASAFVLEATVPYLPSALTAWLGREPEQFATYIVSTYLTPERVKDALGTVISMSVFDLPTMIEVAEKSGISSAAYKIQYQLLLSRPALLMTMVLLGATVSLRSFRSGRIQTMVVTGMIGGFGFFLMAEVSRQVGVASLV